MMHSFSASLHLVLSSMLTHEDAADSGWTTWEGNLEANTCALPPVAEEVKAIIASAFIISSFLCLPYVMRQSLKQDSIITSFSAASRTEEAKIAPLR